MSKKWVTSDIHFNHQRIIEFCPETRGHCTSVDDMNELIIQNFNSVIRNEDTLYMLGDIGFGDVDSCLNLINRINGNKVWIHGNHDRKFWVSDKYKEMKYSIGVIEDTPYKTISHTVDGKKNNIVLFHFPIESWEGKSKGSIHLHGHCHSSPDQTINSRRMDIGVDSNNLMPYHLDSVVRKLLKYPSGDDHHAN